MISVFDVNALRPLLQDFYDITRIRITVFDAQMHEMVSWPEQHQPLCRAIRRSEEGRAACQQCDRDACAQAAGGRGVHIYRCHAGLTEAVVPLHVGAVLVGYLWCGHVFAYPDAESGLAAIRDCTAHLPLTEDDVRAACTQHPMLTESYVRSAARIMQATASFLILERMATLQEDSAAAQLDAYLTAHFTDPLTADAVCAALGLSRSRLYRLCDQLYGCGLNVHIRRLRLEKARQMLLDHPELSIAQVAEKCGFGDYNYFIALFSREVGQSPNTWRKAHHP